MKKVKLAIIACLLVFISTNGQNTFPATGNVGIGTSNPSNRLTVSGSDSGTPSLLIKNTSYSSGHSTGTAALQFSWSNHLSSKIEAYKHTTNTSGLKFYSEYGFGTPQLMMTLQPSGNGGRVGIGTSSPSNRLTISGDDGGNPALLIKNTSYGSGDSNGTASMQFAWANHGAAKIEAYKLTTNATGLKFYTEYGFSTPKLAMTIRPSGDGGRVGIGTTETGSHRLAVEGSIGAREIKVETGAWSDFVFYDDYDLPTLKDVEQHIAEKGHLQDIPSAAEVKKHGINLGEMNAKLLQKIEELMLYTIRQQKEIDFLKEELKKKLNNK